MSAQIVAQAKADLIAAGKDITGDNGAFLITMEAAYRLGLGVVDKPNGHHAEFPVGSGHFFSVDGIMDRAGNFVDVLINAGGAGDPDTPHNVPTWQPNGTVDVGRYRSAVAILDAPPVVIPPVVIPPTVDLSEVLTKLQGLHDEHAQILAALGDVYNAQVAGTAATERLIAAVANINLPVPVVTFPDYLVRAFGASIVAKPR